MKITVASLKHIKYCNIISETISSSAKVRGTGIALRSPVYIKQKIENNNAVIALKNDEFAGFCYIEKWGHGKYVAHSGLIVSPKFRGKGLAKKIKTLTFNHSKNKYPNAKIFAWFKEIYIPRPNDAREENRIKWLKGFGDNIASHGLSSMKNLDAISEIEKKLERKIKHYISCPINIDGLYDNFYSENKDLI